ncbi:helix-turn-helix transcriptional regulator [Streptomyces sp. 150FB]|uniref:helix-turn-helix domain-containing protein n=1 Tax=Streptomyces sp. 150FB TaxID=1576605 RepID=UPI000698A20C|nr:helix-turn-helix transcriptional regulator [Streptomyces sp. 150FB]
MEGTFAAALQERRQAEGLSLRELSAVVRYSAGWLSRIARGKGTPTLALAEACDEALGAGGELLALARAELAGTARPEQLPLATSTFVGRAEALSALDTALTVSQERGMALTLAVDGPPGVGKSALALHWAHRVAGDFADGVLFADLRGHRAGVEPADPGDVLGAFLTGLGVANPPKSADDRAAMFRTAAAQRRLLMVLDGAVDTAQVRQLLPGAAGSTVVVTSRRRLTGLAVATGARRVSLAPMSHQESLVLLRTVLGAARVDAEPAAADALARHCAHLPLALRITAEQLATHPHRPLSHAVDELAEAGLDAMSDHEDPQLAVRAAFDLSYGELRPDVARTFRLLGLAPAARISAKAVAALTGESLVRTRRNLDELVARHLLDETALDLYRTDALLHAYAREKAEAEDAEAAPGATPAAAPGAVPGPVTAGAGVEVSGVKVPGIAVPGITVAGVEVPGRGRTRV